MTKDLKKILMMGNALKILSVLRTALTVGIIAFTVFKAIGIITEKSSAMQS